MPLTVFGQDGGAGPEEGGCSEQIAGSRVTVTGDCYFTPEWLQASSVELHGEIWGEPGSEVIHLTSGSVRTFNFAQTQVQIVAQRNNYLVAALPTDVAEAGFNEDLDVVYFSRKGDTTLLISYETAPRILHQGEGLVVGLCPPSSNNDSCSLVRATSVGSSVMSSSPFPRVYPKEKGGGWILIVGLTMFALSRRRWNAARVRAPGDRVKES